MILLALIIDVHAAGYFKGNLNARSKQGDVLGSTKFSYIMHRNSHFSTPRVKSEQINRRRKLILLSNRGLSTESVTLAHFSRLGPSLTVDRTAKNYMV